MIKRSLLFAALFCCHMGTYAADLLDVYTQALHSDPIFQQAIAQRFITRAGVPITLSQLLPNLSFNAQPYITRTAFSGSSYAVAPDTNVPVSPRNNTQRSYSMTLTATQTIFNFTQFFQVSGAIANAKGADATLNAALQNLMTRVASAYFAVLKDEDNLSYSEASKIAYAQQLDQVKQQYHVGIKTITDVYTAQASYDSAVADYIQAETTLANDRENLRVITGVYYPHLAKLSNRFPLITPKPQNVETWVRIALAQNWTIKASQYSVDAARQNVKQQFAGHLPTVQLQGTLDRLYTNNINGYQSFVQRNGPGTQTDRSIGLNINVPIFSGGGITAQTNQATYNYELTQQQLEQTVRDTLNTTRQSYLGILLGVSQVKADREAIRSTISSLRGMEESYRVGTETLVNVLNQQQKVYEAQTQYATDRYTFINNIFALKKAAGTLSFFDLEAINCYLTDTVRKKIAIHKKLTVKKNKKKKTSA